MAHTESTEGVRIALQNGVDSIEYGAKATLQNGIPIALGNDVACPWGSLDDYWRELVYFQKY